MVNQDFACLAVARTAGARPEHIGYRPSVGLTIFSSAGAGPEQLAKVRLAHVPLLHRATLVALVVERVYTPLSDVLAGAADVADGLVGAAQHGPHALAAADVKRAEVHEAEVVDELTHGLGKGWGEG
eukprot:scaffold22055_cov42-Phaeocystis_antarctica.AAC.2